VHHLRRPVGSQKRRQTRQVADRQCIDHAGRRTGSDLERAEARAVAVETVSLGIEGDARGDLRMGWVDVLTIKDLAAMMPPEVEREAAALAATWESQSASLVEDEASFQRVDGAIDALRQETLRALRALR
jgi:hypothetical protein